MIAFALRIVALCGIAQAYVQLSDEAMRLLPHPGKDLDVKDLNSLLSPILIPRVSGTEGNARVREHIAGFIRESLPHWNLEFQNSTARTPVTGDEEVPFVNIIATRDPPWLQPGDVGRLVVAAHYDSKLTPKGFIGAIDSAAPCAMIMHAMRSIDSALTARWTQIEEQGMGETHRDEPGIQVMFLDGEEAFAQWTATDSIYGARSLAASMENTMYPAMSTYRNPISSISLFVLLDLLGTKDPRIPNYFPTTRWAYDRLGLLESRLRSVGQYKSAADRAQKTKKPSKKRQWFPKDLNIYWGGIEDDHLPFLRRGVHVLHVIPHPFPKVWHTMDDDAGHLDIPTVEDWSVLVTAFMAEWMNLDEHMRGGADHATDHRRSEL
ncbi:hypothetical protein KEM52_006356 [Ascosphaera acerosa]|nr:hypothetical protein KEM52_006356 [Ascosphaera acerosa]